MALYLGNNKVKLNAYSGDYKFKDGKLIWANPDLYIRAKFPYNPKIDTGYVPKQNTRAVVKFTFTVFPDWSKKNETLSIITNNGSYNTTTVFSVLVTNNIYEKPAGIWWAGKRGGFNAYSVDSFINNHTYRFDISAEATGPQILYDDATNKEIVRVGSNFDFDASSVSKSLLLFENRYGTQQYAKGQTIYYVQLYEDANLVHNFVPVPKGLQIGDFTVPSNGMFDIVEQKFYGNSGSGEFEYGKNGNYVIKDGKLVWANPNLYLESSGTQYIVTDYFANEKTEIQSNLLVFEDATGETRNCLWGSADSYQVNAFILSIDSNPAKTSYPTRGNNKIGISISKKPYTKTYVTMGKSIYFNNEVVGNFSEQEFTSIYPLYVFCKIEKGTKYFFTKGRIYDLKIYENSTLLHSFVPVPKGLQIGDFTVPSNGMFDIVEQKFYANQGTGNFKLGSDEDAEQSFAKVKLNLLQGDYLIKDGKLLWANPDLYIASTGQPYIDTGYICNTNTKVDCVFSPISIDTFPTTQTYLFGTGGKYLGTDVFNFHYWIRAGAGDSVWWPYIGTSGSGSAIPNFAWEMCEKYKVIMNGKTNGPQELYYNNGELIRSVSTNLGFTGSQNTLFLFKINGHVGNETAKKRIYSFKIYESDVLIHNFVPVPAGLQIGSFVVPSNGMFDIVEQKFYENKGTGDFEFGGNQSDYVISDGKLLWANKKLYIENADENKSPFINTLYALTGNDTFSILAQGNKRVTPINNDTVMGLSERINPYPSYYLLYHWNNENDVDLNYGTTHFDGHAPYEVPVLFETKISDSKLLYVVNGEKLADFDIVDFGISSNCYAHLFCTAYYTNGGVYTGSYYPLYGRIYYCKFYKNGVDLVRYLVPVYKGLQIGDFTVPSNGMFDIVEQKFYGNEGTGEFLINKDE